MWEQNSRRVGFQKLLIIAVTNDALKRFIQNILLQRISKSIEKDEIRVTVYICLAEYPVFRLIRSFSQKSGLNRIHHRNHTLACRSLSIVDPERAVLSAFVVIDEGMIDVNLQLLKINVAPS